MRKEMCCTHILNGNNHKQTAGEIAETLMNEKREQIGGLSLVKYALTLGGVYIWMMGQQDIYEMNAESVFFIVDGQKTFGKQIHNAILMWNPNLLLFLLLLLKTKTRPKRQRRDIAKSPKQVSMK
jgi:hypothetical protein